MKPTLLPAIVIVIAYASPCIAADPQEPANLVLRGGRIATMDEKVPVAEAIAVRGDRIAAVGSDEELQPWIGEQTQVIELNGKLAIPGFVEGHGHFLALGRSKRIIDLSQTRSYDDIIRLVKQAADRTPVGQWIEGRGWHQAKWETEPEPRVEGYPVHETLSRASPKHPVLLTHASGHMCLANAQAMKLAGIDRRTKDPPGGEILRDGLGRATGVFRETASGLIHAAQSGAQANRTPRQVRKEFDEAVRLATQECLAHGVTSFQDAGSSFSTIDRFRQLAQSGRLRVRLWVMVNESNAVLADRLAAYRTIGLAKHHLTVRAIKRLMDGALGSHGAWLLEPYDDLPESTGLNTTSPSVIRETAQLAIRHGFQLCVHAIGDRANRETLDIFEETFQANASKRDLRWRIEHAQHLAPSDIPRFSQLGVVASMQAIHCTSDAPYVVKRLGMQRARQGAYAWRSLIDAGAMVSNGTDTPVERVDPIQCFYAAVTRKPWGEGPFFPEQRMTRQEALRCYTLDAAYAAFEEHLKGSLTPGKLADIVVLSHDILSVAEDEILETQVLCTIVGGDVVYERKNGAKP
jgi:predicted amidohydrolase YtcJ